MRRRGYGIVALAAVGGCTVKPAPATAPEAIPVTTALATPARGGATLTATGTVRFKRETGLAFNTSGRIAAINVTEGQAVGAGQLLAVLDGTGLNAAASAARADAARARADYDRLRKLGTQGWVTRARVESAAAASSAATARVEQTGFDVRFARIVAPAPGIVLRRAFEPGQMATAATPVITLGEAASGFVLRLPLSDTDAGGLRLGAPAIVTLPAVPSSPLPATVSEIGGRGDDRTGTFQVELRLPPRPGLRSGLIGSATLSTGGGAAGVEVPAAAVFAVRADEGFVYVVAPNHVVRARLVGIGAVGDRSVVVTHGLAPGTEIVVSGVDRLHDGTPVVVAGRPGR